MDVTGSAGLKSERVRGTQAVAATHEADVEPPEVARLDPNAVLAVGYPVSHFGVTYGSRCNGVGRVRQSDGDVQLLSSKQGNSGACACGSQGVHGNSSSGQRRGTRLQQRSKKPRDHNAGQKLYAAICAEPGAIRSTNRVGRATCGSTRRMIEARTF
jgi:hypothetical protein